MNRWKTIFAFVTGILVMHLLGHIMLAVEGVLPFTSSVLGFTLTREINMIVIALNTIFVLITAWLAFVHEWDHEMRVSHPA